MVLSKIFRDSVINTRSFPDLATMASFFMYAESKIFSNAPSRHAYLNTYRNLKEYIHISPIRDANDLVCLPIAMYFLSYIHGVYDIFLVG